MLLSLSISIKKAQGQSWVENGITLEQVLTRNAFIADVYPALWTHLSRHLQQAQQQGWLK